MVVIGYNGAELVDIACVTTAFDLANRLGATPAYTVTVASTDGADITCESGLKLCVPSTLADVPHTDTVIVSGGRGHEAAARDPELVGAVRRLASTARRVASVCTGATVLAEAGLLDGRRATTHWFHAGELAAMYPAVQVDAAPIFIRDGALATSGGVTASLDLALAFIEEDHGPEMARQVAMGMVTYLQRPGNQAQMSMFITAPRPDHAALRAVLDHVATQPSADLTTSALAARIGVSARQLTRLFTTHLGEPPATAVRRVRLEIAAQLIVGSELPLAQIARRCGFGSAETLRQAFVARFGVSPRIFRLTQSRTPAQQPPVT